MFNRDATVPVRLANKGHITPSLETSKSLGEGRKHCFLVAQFPWFLLFINLIKCLGGRAEKINYYLQ